MMIMSRRILIKICSSSSNIAHSLKIFQSFQVCKPIFFANYYNMKIFLDSGSVAKIYLFFFCVHILLFKQKTFANCICLKLVFLWGRGIPQFLWPGLKISPLPCWFSLLSNRLHVLIISQR